MAEKIPDPNQQAQDDREAEELQDAIAAVQCQLMRLGYSKNGLFARMLLKSLGLNKWRQLNLQDWQYVHRVLQSADPDQGLEELQVRVYRLEMAIVELVEGRPKQTAIQSILKDFSGRFVQVVNLKLRTIYEDILSRFKEDGGNGAG